MTALLRVRGLTKSYPGVLANDDVSFEVATGSIHALLGENGAGKSTLVKAIFGLVAPDAGEMALQGQPHAPASPQEARTAGVGMVFQHFSLFDALDVAENVALGMSNPPARRALAARIREVSAAYGLPLDPSRIVGDLSAGERQRVEIVRCLLGAPKLLIMDEPTSVLTPQEAGTLFATLRKLASEGTGILYISHKLEEIRALCDAATILRGGRVVARTDPRAASAAELAEAMVGSRLSAPAARGHAPGDVVLELRGLSLAAEDAFGTPLCDVSVDLRAGEVLGVGGVAGNGQEALLAAIAGERTAKADAIRLEGAPVGHLGPDARRARGLSTAPEERLGHAAAPDLSLTENAVLSGYRRKRLGRRGFVDWRAARDFAGRIIDAFDVRTPGADHAARALSGGNLQKFVIGREILQRPKVLAVNQPTWGVDAKAAAAIRGALVDLARDGAAILVISQDLDELLEITDRFAALNVGRLGAPVATSGLTMERIGLMLGGAEAEMAHAAE